jgi:hypothetical protein
MNRRIAFAASAATLVCAGAALFPGGVASAGTAEFDDYGNACSVAGTLSSPMGVRYAPDEATYDVAGTLDCTSSKYSHGTLTGKGSGVLSCFGGFSEATYKIVWSNGETSLISTKAGDFTYGTGNYGEVMKGAMQGSEVGMAWGREAAGAEYKCASDKVHSAEFAGGIGFHDHAAHS